MAGETVEGLLHGLGQRRVGVHVARTFESGQVPLLGERQLGQQLRHVGADQVPAEELEVLAIAISFTKPIGSPRPFALPFAENGNLATLTS